MDVKINNPEQIPEQIVRAAIAMMEQEEGRTVQEISIRRTGSQMSMAFCLCLSLCPSSASVGSPAIWWER